MDDSAEKKSEKRHKRSIAHILELGFSVARVSLKSRAPGGFFCKGVQCCIYSCSCQLRGTELDHAILCEAELHQIP